MSFLLAALIVSMTAMFARMGHADGVCGDSAVDSPEQCDDGNLVSGDGCSNTCTLEICGNGTVDTYEQCDGGNASAGDGCNQYCQIEFCGDHQAQAGIGEQCDDGNGLSGDGCSSLCKLEGIPSSSSSSLSMTSTSSSSFSSSFTSSASFASSVSSVSSSYASLMAPQVQAVLDSLQSPESVLLYINPEEQSQLLQIMRQMQTQTSLTDQEKVWAGELLDTLTAAKEAERERYTNLLKEFIATPISGDVVVEKNLSENRLVDVSVPVAVDELNRAIAIVERGEIKEQVQLDLEKLRRQGIDLSSVLPSDILSLLDSKTKPVTVFETLKRIKEETEKHATNDLDASLGIIRNDVNTVRDALPVLQREYGLSPEEITPLLSDIESLSKSVSKSDAYRVVASVNRLLKMLQRRDVLSSTDALAAEVSAPHAAAHAAAVIRAADIPVSSVPDIHSLAVGMSAKAPAEYKEAFEIGGVNEQRTTLLRFLGNDEKSQAALSTLPEKEREAFKSRLGDLSRAVLRVGDNDDVNTSCDDSMPAALRCTDEYLSDLETAIRAQSVFGNLIGHLQDFFGIGS